MAFYRATGQAHKPAPPVNTGKSTAVNKSGPGQVGFGICTQACQSSLIHFQGDSERKHGMEEFIGADPITFDHALLFKKLQSFSLEWRLHDPYSSLVSDDDFDDHHDNTDDDAHDIDYDYYIDDHKDIHDDAQDDDHDHNNDFYDSDHNEDHYNDDCYIDDHDDDFCFRAGLLPV